LRWVRAWVLGGSSVGLATVGHLVGGGHLEPAFLGLLTAAMALASYGWLRRERGLLAITAAVAGIQVVSHAAFSVGHVHPMSAAMVAGHATAAVVLAVFLRWGEARTFAVARRRYLQWATAVRCALAGLSPMPQWRRSYAGVVHVARSGAIHRTLNGRDPPVAAWC
jgi:hypothetical protein